MRQHQLDAGLALVGFIVGFLGACWLDPAKEQPFLWFESMFGMGPIYYLVVSLVLAAFGFTACVIHRWHTQRMPKNAPIGLRELESRVIEPLASWGAYGIISGAAVHAIYDFRAGMVLLLLGVMGHFINRNLRQGRMDSQFRRAGSRLPTNHE